MATRFINESTGSSSVTTCPSRTQSLNRSTERLDDADISALAKQAILTAKKTSRTRKRLLMATLGFLLYPSVGCTMATGLGSKLAHHDALDDFMVSYRNQAWAAKAWHCRKHKHCNHRFSSDLENGFRAGYQAVADGGNGCVPAVCPQAYWGWQYQTADGSARMNAWFEGYPLGVQAAEQDGIGHWSRVQTSMAFPPPANPATGLPPGNMLPVNMNSAPVISSFSDSAEIIPTPLPSPVYEAPAPGYRGAISSAVPGSSTKADAPPTATKAGDMRAVAPTMPVVKPRAETSPTARPTPKAAPVIPQPSTDPFGFN